MTSKKSLSLLLLIYFLAPFLVLIYKFPLNFNFDAREFYWAFKNTVFQATLSAVCSLALGTWIALGLIKVSGRIRKFAEIVCLAPNFLPPLFILLVVLYWVDPFPVGIFGIGFVHTLINFGIVAVALARSLESKLGGMAELARVEGSGRIHFLFKAAIPILKKDYLFLFLFVFSICFSSFSIPLIVGGGKGTTIEMLIYEKIRLSMEWGAAVLLSIIQLGFLGFLTWLLISKKSIILASEKSIKWLGSWSGMAVLTLFLLFFVFGYLDGILSGLSSWAQFNEIRYLVLQSAAGTLFIGLSTGFLILFLLGTLTFAMDFKYLSFFIRSYLAPSTTLTGFAFLVFGPNEGWIASIKIPLALGILFTGPLYRLGWETEVQRLQGQLEVGRLLGASPLALFRKIVWPQVYQRALLLAGLGAAWACGDFALSRILAYKDMTLGLMTETLMSSYRLNMATLLSSAVLLAAIFCFLFFWSLGYVYRRKSS